MVRPLNAAKPATTSSMSAPSQVTLMRGACDCSASERCIARYWSIDNAGPAVGVVTAAGIAVSATGGGATEPDAAATCAAVVLVQDANPVRSVPICTRTWPSPRLI